MEPVVVIFLHALEGSLKLLVAELRLLDHSGKLAHLVFELVDPHQEVRPGRLGEGDGAATANEAGGRKDGKGETVH